MDTVPAPSGIPSPKAQSWGAVLSIVIIILMIVVGAFYAWGQRIAEQQLYQTPQTASSTTY